MPVQRLSRPIAALSCDWLRPSSSDARRKTSWARPSRTASSTPGASHWPKVDRLILPVLALAPSANPFLPKKA